MYTLILEGKRKRNRFLSLIFVAAAVTVVIRNNATDWKRRRFRFQFHSNINEP